MRAKKIIIIGLMANALSACSSPPKLSEPTGDWISFEPVMSKSPTRQDENASVNNVIPLSRPVISAPVIHVERSEVPLVLTDGKNVPLYKAVRDVVPSSWHVVLSPPVSKDFKDLVSWTGNDQWPFVLRKMLVSHNLEAQIDDRQKQVVIVYGKSPAVAVPVSVKPLTSKPTVTKPATSKPVNPFVGTPPGVVVSPAPLVTTPKPMVTPPVQTWSISKGVTLKEGIMSWAASEKCSASGTTNWTVLWNTPVNYRVDAPLRFSGNFLTALNEVFALYQRAEKPLYAVTNTPQCLIRIEDK